MKGDSRSECVDMGWRPPRVRTANGNRDALGAQSGALLAS